MSNNIQEYENIGKKVFNSLNVEEQLLFQQLLSELLLTYKKSSTPFLYFFLTSFVSYWIGFAIGARLF